MRYRHLWLLPILAASYFALTALSEAPTKAVAVTWTLMGEAASIICVLNLYDSIRDHRLLRESGKNGAALLLTRAAIRQDAIRVVQSATWTTAGLVALFAAPAITKEQRERLHIPTWTTTSVAITMALVIIMVGLIANAVADRQVRHRFYEHDEVR
jgi:hypothetical protein